MTIDQIRDGEVLTLHVGGRLDTMTAPELEAVVKDLPEDITKLVIDLKALDYMSSSGLRVLLLAHRTMNGRGDLVIAHVNDYIMEIFDVTGFSGILTIV